MNQKKLKNLAVSNSKTNALTINSTKQSSGDSGLPTIGSKNRLKAIDDDNNDDYEERAPVKSKGNVRNISEDDDQKKIYRTKGSEGSQQRGNSVGAYSQNKNSSPELI